MVYSHSLELGPGKQVPALLVILGTTEKYKKEDYEAARKLYRKVNYVVTIANQEEFKVMARRQRMAIKHLTIDFRHKASVHL